MKKLLFVLVAALLTVSVSAQEQKVVTAHKTFDNWYLGINGGAATPMQKWGNAGFMKGVAPSVGLRLGKNLTTVLGIALDANAYIESDAKSLMKTRTFVDAINVDGVGTLNLSNFFGGYIGKPRRVELIALGGFGWTRQFGGLTQRLLSIWLSTLVEAVPCSSISSLLSCLVCGMIMVVWLTP